ncbi:MAG TPA: hypothetical protein VFB45_03980 [Pseudolabrys sp.]|nr:hypothetical protein [Pseudolabrys sp.]
MRVSRDHLVSTLRRDASFVANAVVAVVFISFAGLAIAAALLDLAALRH